MLRFTKDFTQQEPISETGIENAVSVLKSGRIHRYNVPAGEKGFAAELEEAFAAYMGATYCLACASCGSALYLALKSAGVRQGDKVLCNAYTLAPVPGAVHNAGADIVLVDIRDDYTIDLADLEQKAAASGAGYLLLSHMRGHIADMDGVMAVCSRHRLVLIEDCAHTMGASWNGKKSGTFGKIGCYSTQTYKHMNSGEGGLLITDDPDVMAKAILYSGSYMLYTAHTSRPEEASFENIKRSIPNFSSRMDNLRAGLLLPQLKELDARCKRWNELHDHLADGLRNIPGVRLPERDAREAYVGSSIQFNLPSFSYEKMEGFLHDAEQRGIQLKWFGKNEPAGFTSRYDSWQYLGPQPDLPNTKKVLATMCDMRLPLTFTKEDCSLIARILEELLSR